MELTMFRKTAAISAYLLLYTTTASAVLADTTNSAILEQRINALEQQLQQLRAELQQQTKTTNNTNNNSDVKIIMGPTPKLESTDGNFVFQPTGRILTDYAMFDDDKIDHPNGASIRRARLGARGKFAKYFNYKTEIDFGKGNFSVKDAYISYSGIKDSKFTIGYFKPFFGLEELTSSNNITFIERSAATDSFTTDRKIGIAFGTNGNNWSFNTGLFNDAITTASSDDESWSVSGRLTYAPILDTGKLLHFGVSGNYIIPDAATDSVAFSARAENNHSTLKAVDTGTINDIDSILAYGLETAFAYDNLSLQAEYMAVSTDNNNSPDVDLSGYYAQASWILTGESRPYKAKAGKFVGVKPDNPFSANGGTGAWEIALRYSNIDLNDNAAAINGGKMDNITFGLNWYINNYSRLMANYIMVDTDNNAVTANDDPNILLLRAQANF